MGIRRRGCGKRRRGWEKGEEVGKKETRCPSVNLHPDKDESL